MIGLTSERGREMLSYLPPHTHHSNFIRALFQAQGGEFDRLRQALDDVLDQYFVRTATWGLDWWEEELGLETVEAEGFEARRGRVIAKLRSSASFSAATLEGVASAYTGKPVMVTVDAHTYTITFEMESSFITAPGFYRQIESIIHAHMSPEYRAIFRYSQDLHLQFEFIKYLYPFPITGTFLCGTRPDYSTLGRMIPNELELSQSSYYTGQWMYRFAGKVLTGSDEVIETLHVQTLSELELESGYRKSTRTFNLCGNFHCGTGVLT